jgi:hypothetical protein
MTFKAGDKVMVVAVQGYQYPKDVKPGDLGVIAKQCICRDAMAVALTIKQRVYSVAFDKGLDCLAAYTLRKIDPDGRDVGSWDNCFWKPNKVETNA